MPQQRDLFDESGQEKPAPERAPVRPPITVRIADACRMTGIGRSKLYELIQAGEIEIVKIGSMTLVPVVSLEALIERHRR